MEVILIVIILEILPVTLTLTLRSKFFMYTFISDSFIYDDFYVIFLYSVSQIITMWLHFWRKRVNSHAIFIFYDINWHQCRIKHNHIKLFDIGQPKHLKISFSAPDNACFSKQMYRRCVLLEIKRRRETFFGEGGQKISGGKIPVHALPTQV